MGARRKGEASGGAESSGQDADPVLVVHAQTLFWLGEDHEVGHPALTAGEDLSRSGALGRAVVVQNDAVSDRHCARRPGEYDVLVEQFCDSEKGETIDDGSDVATGDGEAPAALQDLLDVLTMANDLRSLKKVGFDFEAPVDFDTRVAMVVVERLQGGESRALFFFVQLGRRGPTAYDPVGLERKLKSNSIKLLLLTQ